MPNPKVARSASSPDLRIRTFCRHFFSGANRDRTGDLLLAKKPAAPIDYCSDADFSQYIREGVQSCRSDHDAITTVGASSTLLCVLRLKPGTGLNLQRL